MQTVVDRLEWVLCSALNETTNELTMRDMFAGGGGNGVRQLRDPSDKHRGKMPTFEALDESSPAAASTAAVSPAAAGAAAATGI